jgi:hypothetical protein
VPVVVFKQSSYGIVSGAFIELRFIVVLIAVAGRRITDQLQRAVTPGDNTDTQ